MAPKRPSPTAQPRWAPRPAPPKATPTKFPKLTEEDIQKLSALMGEHFRWDADPRFFQLEGVRAQIEGVDMIIQAPTGSGKTAVAASPHLWPTSEGKVTIMVCPLLALEEEMVQTFKTDFGLDAIAINSATGILTRTVVEDLLSGKYHIILISPEMLQSPAFVNRLLRRRAFAKRVMSVFVDEAHCVSHWGSSFRKKYSTIGAIRAFLPKGTPVIAVTATLTARVRRDLHNVLHISKGRSRFINIGNDRPNVSMVVRACQHPQNTLLDTNFIIPQHPKTPSDIPKTYIYVDNISIGNDIINHLCTLLAKRNPSLPAHELVRPFNATMSHEYRAAAMAAFRANPPADWVPSARVGAGQPSSNSEAISSESYVRILVCTDAAGMGCNVVDVDLVVQWKLPKTLSNWIQRAGRAARARNRTGLAVLLVERSAYSVDLRPETLSAMKQAKAGGKGGKGKSRASALPKDYAAAHGVNRGGAEESSDTLPCEGVDPVVDADADDEGLLAFVQARICRRKIWAEVFESRLEPPLPGVSCCDICDSTLYNRTRPGGRDTAPKPRMRARGQPDFRAQSQLCKWRKEIFSRDLSTSQLDASTVLDEATITSLTTVGPLSAAQITALLQDTWTWWPKYGIELLAFLATLEIVYRPFPKAPAKSTATLPDAPTTLPGPSAPARMAAKRGAESGGSAIALPQTPAPKRMRLQPDDAWPGVQVQDSPANSSQQRAQVFPEYPIQYPSPSLYPRTTVTGPPTPATPQHSVAGHTAPHYYPYPIPPYHADYYRTAYHSSAAPAPTPIYRSLPHPSSQPPTSSSTSSMQPANGPPVYQAHLPGMHSYHPSPGQAVYPHPVAFHPPPHPYHTPSSQGMFVPAAPPHPPSVGHNSRAWVPQGSPNASPSSSSTHPQMYQGGSR
ncbi:hypothetical protein VTO73DRAFT_10517 [Trametes versicolor]